MRSRRRAVSAERREEASRELCAKLLARDDVKAAMRARRPAAVYMATAQELDLTELVEALWAADVTVTVPCRKGAEGRYAMCVYDNQSAMVEGEHGIPEPAEQNEIAAADMGLWIVPGLAFGRDGTRLGYGGGWYDRLLAGAAEDAAAIGVGYDFQLVDTLPQEAHDRRLTGVETVEED